MDDKDPFWQFMVALGLALTAVPAALLLIGMLMYGTPQPLGDTAWQDGYGVANRPWRR